MNCSMKQVRSAWMCKTLKLAVLRIKVGFMSISGVSQEKKCGEMGSPIFTITCAQLMGFR